MLPSFKPGDHVVTFAWSKIKAGDVVVFAGDAKLKRVLPVYIKRVLAIEDKSLHVIGDNKNESAKMPLVPAKNVLGRVIWKY